MSLTPSGSGAAEARASLVSVRPRYNDSPSSRPVSAIFPAHHGKKLSIHAASPTSPGRVSLELGKFADEDFKAEKYVHGILTQSTEEGVRGFHQALTDAKEAAAVDLQRNVYRNYNEFVLISKEISKLESDMLSLRSLLGELKDINSILQPEESVPEKVTVELVPTEDNANSSAKTAPALSGLAKQSDEESRHQQMEVLYDVVEGLQKVLPEWRNRYVVRDGSQARFAEVNPINYKTVQNVHVYILSDTLLVTTKKKNIISGKSKMILDKCWSLADVAVIDMKDSTEVSNAFKVMRHPDMYIYRCESLDDKRSFLGAFKRYTDELMLQKRQAIETAKSRKDITINPSEPHSPSRPDSKDTDRHRAGGRPTRDELTLTDVKWLMELTDELDVLIAHRDFENAVALIEEARTTLGKANAETSRVIKIRTGVEERINRLAQLVSLDLANPVASKTQVQANIDKLLRLGMGDQARDFFLTARIAIIRHRIRLIRFDGDVATYISDLANVVFRLIRSTCDWYGSSFHDTTMASGFMKWVNNELQNFCRIFRQQVFDSKPSFSIIADCLQHTLHHCKQLEDVGLDVAFVLEEAFHDDMVAAIMEHSKECETIVVAAVLADTFGPLRPESPYLVGREDDFADITAQVSQSVYELYAVLMEFGADVSVLMSITLYGKIVNCLTGFFDVYIRKLVEVASRTDWMYKQHSTILVDATFIVEDLLPKVSGQLAHRFERPIPELEDMRDKLRVLNLAMNAKFVTQTKNKLIKNKFNFPALDYSNNGGILDNTRPTEHIMRLIEELNLLQGSLDPTLPRKDILANIIDEIFTFMNDPSCWQTNRGPRRLGFQGVQQLILDIHFFLRICEALVSEETNAKANLVCEKGLRMFFSQNKELKAALKTGDWYDKRVDEVMNLIAKEFPHLLSVS
ncbi:hypothetical protein DFS34DRAFT_636127 [Phlyctochytrium arcticum]|nr:hypothetical protein DFS34DRAFT_636127 [Phlyctochytrium arcticum]